MNTAYQKQWPLYLSTKNTILKKYDGRISSKKFMKQNGGPSLCIKTLVSDLLMLFWADSSISMHRDQPKQSGVIALVLVAVINHKHAYLVVSCWVLSIQILEVEKETKIGKMKVTVTTRSGRELVKGGVELSDSASVADLQEAIYKRKRCIHRYQLKSDANLC